MNKPCFKLIAVALLLAAAVSLAVMSSYAWLTLSGNPVVDGIQVSIGGSGSILVAPDLTRETEDGRVHYPGVFSGTLQTAQQEEYRYLREMDGLLPVSTADGVHWFLPAYYEAADPEVLAGRALCGELKPIWAFELDDTLRCANPAPSFQEERTGSYAYLDFWVVSPVEGTRIRISADSGDGGSFVIGRMPAGQEDADGDGKDDRYTLEAVNASAMASARVGFLVNPERADDRTMTSYMASTGYSDRYNSLLGRYAEPGERLADAEPSSFIIYEPNGDLHPAEAGYVHTAAGLSVQGYDTGGYVRTRPIGYQNGEAALTDVDALLTVQKTSRWAVTAAGESLLELAFQAAVVRIPFGSKTLPEVERAFYTDYLQGQYAGYMDTGAFFKSTAALYQALSPEGSVSADSLAALPEAGATEDVVIATLQKNVPQRIRVFFWLEGQDADCIKNAASSGLAVNIQLAGSNGRLYG